MKKAPNFKHLPADKFTEAIIFAGSEAYSHAKGWEEGMGTGTDWHDKRQ